MPPTKKSDAHVDVPTEKPTKPVAKAPHPPPPPPPAHVKVLAHCPVCGNEVKGGQCDVDGWSKESAHG